ncbi:MAG: hypothetical protein K2N63_06455 [Lachnospiraceae bacterium]|nr:hypothetical protein [Lachnospiraceae bacterium]
MNEKFYEAALRHFVDAGILKVQECYDNAVYLYGNSAECALKTMIKTYCGVNSKNIFMNKYKHDLKKIAGDLFSFVVNSSTIALLDPALGLKQQIFTVPEVLFRDHPERRYEGNGIFTLGDAEECERAVHIMIDEMIKQYMDGYIN